MLEQNSGLVRVRNFFLNIGDISLKIYTQWAISKILLLQQPSPQLPYQFNFGNKGKQFWRVPSASKQHLFHSSLVQLYLPNLKSEKCNISTRKIISCREQLKIFIPSPPPPKQHPRTPRSTEGHIQQLRSALGALQSKNYLIILK